MPLYVYRCDSCGHEVERLQRFSDPPLTTCGRCGGPLEKVLFPPGLQFKGTGWYVTDYARRGASESGPSKSETDETP
ncbi:MAG: zinc ribbon domain-containing protein [Acidobacteria bacterium]|nr:zinc ribbon domain-containing protein [Acidobacteriota bacterium]MDW7984537.1 FmdB family zinc ribbon protein [Acidobacteriota bacterium]